MTRWLIVGASSLAFASMAHAGAQQPGLADLVQAGEDAAAPKLVESGGDVNVRQGDGSTALDWATYRLDVPLVEALLKHGADPDLMNRFGSDPLDEAVKAANIDLVKMLLRAHAEVNEANTYGQTALMLASRTGVLPIVRLLVRRGANVNAREHVHGQTALMWAAAQGYPDVVRYLVRHGASVNTRETFNDWLDKATQFTSEPRAQYRPEGGLTPLLYAIRSGCLECVKSIVRSGANVDQPTPDGVTPLIASLDNRHFEIAKYLLEHGANPNTWDWYGRTPLYVAVDMHTYHEFGRGGPSGAPPSAQKPPGTAGSRAGKSAGTTAVDIARMLLQAGVDPNAQLTLHPHGHGANSGRFEGALLRDGATPLLRAALSHDDAMIELLLEHGAAVDLPNVQGVTPLMAAAGMGILGPAGSSVPDHRGDYARGAAARALSTIAILLKAGADVNARVKDTTSYLGRVNRNASVAHRQGETALYGAIYWGWTPVVQYLLQHGARVDIKDDLGRTPLMAARHGIGIRGFKPVKGIIALITKAAAGSQQVARSISG
ncbi:MAG: ankyrin repeat domain-containing protein [Steroidobacteraceae bacterium]